MQYAGRFPIESRAVSAAAKVGGKACGKHKNRAATHGDESRAVSAAAKAGSEKIAARMARSVHSDLLTYTAVELNIRNVSNDENI